MGLEVVLNEILAKGQEEEHALLAAAQKEREKLLSDAEGKADEVRAKRLHQTDQKVEALRRELLSAAEFEARRTTRDRRREHAEDFRARVLQALSSLPADRNKAILDKLVAQAKKELPKGRVHARAADLATLGKGGFDKGNDLPIAGGFQVESPDGSIVLDYRYETLLDGVWKQLLTENQTLFEG